MFNFKSVGRRIWHSLRPAALKKLIIGESRAKHSISSMTVSSSKTYMKKPLAINLIMIFWMFISTELSKARLRGPILRRQHYQRLSMRQSINIKMPCHRCWVTTGQLRLMNCLGNYFGLKTRGSALRVLKITGSKTRCARCG